MRRIPEEWRVLLDGLASSVRAKANDTSAFLSDPGPAGRLGYAWKNAVSLVGKCFEHLMRLIRADIGFEEGTHTLASMVLVQRAIVHLEMELESGGTPTGRHDKEEQTIRVYRALKALHYQHDDVALKRVRALRVVETCTPFTEILDDHEIEASVERMRGHAREDGRDFDEAQQRAWFRSELPMLKALNARSMLADVDPAFSDIDPLIVLEELAEARDGTRGGKVVGGEGKTGPARALARLALQCGGLEYVQGDDEPFDDAVERVRRNLHMTRSRFRDELRTFPTGAEAVSTQE